MSSKSRGADIRAAFGGSAQEIFVAQRQCSATSAVPWNPSLGLRFSVRLNGSNVAETVSSGCCRDRPDTLQSRSSLRTADRLLIDRELPPQPLSPAPILSHIWTASTRQGGVTLGKPRLGGPRLLHGYLPLNARRLTQKLRDTGRK